MGFEVGVISDELGSIKGRERKIEGSVEAWLRWAEENPVNGFEIRTCGGRYVHLLKPNEAKQAARLIHQAGLRVHALAAGLGKEDLSVKARVKRQLATIDTLIGNAQIFQTNRIRVFAGWRRRDLPGSWDDILRFFEKALKKIPEGIVLCIENEPATGCATLGDIARLAKAFGNDPRIGAIYDPGNSGYDVSLIHALRILGKIENRPLLDFVNQFIAQEVREYGSIIRLVHAKNTILDEDGVKTRTVKLDSGMVDFPTFFWLLKEKRIDVPIDLEPHRPKAGQLDDAVRAVPGGPGYGDPEIATEDYKILTTMLKEPK